MNMSNYDLEAIASVYRSFVSGFIDYALEYRYGEKYPLEVTAAEFVQDYGYENVLDNFLKIMELYNKTIMNEAAEYIGDYMTFFEVETDKNVDEFKLIYFIGLRIAELLEKHGMTLEAKIILFAVVIQLNERLKKVTNNDGRPELKVRLKNAIRKQEVKKRLGDNGIYLIYKCAYRMLQKQNQQERVAA